MHGMPQAEGSSLVVRALTLKPLHAFRERYRTVFSRSLPEYTKEFVTSTRQTFLSYLPCMVRASGLRASSAYDI